MKNRTRIIIGVIIVAIVLITVVSVLLETNPPVVQEPPWDSPQTRALAVRACFDCHSNQTKWPWYTKLPFGSWLSVVDTLGGRGNLNFSEYGVPSASPEGNRPHDYARAINNGSMPPVYYTWMHPEAVLTDAEKQQLITGLQNTMK